MCRQSKEVVHKGTWQRAHLCWHASSAGTRPLHIANEVRVDHFHVFMHASTSLCDHLHEDNSMSDRQSRPIRLMPTFGDTLLLQHHAVVDTGRCSGARM